MTSHVTQQATDKRKVALNAKTSHESKMITIVLYMCYQMFEFEYTCLLP